MDAVTYQQDAERKRLERKAKLAGMLAHAPQSGTVGGATAMGIAQIIAAFQGKKAQGKLDVMDAQQREQDINLLKSMQGQPDLGTAAQVRDPRLQQLAMMLATATPAKRQIVDGPDGNKYYADNQEPVLPGVKADPATMVTPRQTFEQKQAEIDLRRKQIENEAAATSRRFADQDEEMALGRDVEKRQAGKLSAGSEKALNKYQDDYFGAQRNAGELETLASEWERSKPLAGKAGQFSEFMKRVTGEENGETLLRKKFVNLRNSQVVKNLPPGVASDRDIEIAMQGYPTDTTNPETMAAFLRGMAKLERVNEQFSEFAATYIDQNNGTRGMVEAWKKQSQPTAQSKPVSVATPDGKTMTFPDQKSADEFKRAAGIR